MCSSLITVSITPARIMSVESFADSARVRAMCCLLLFQSSSRQMGRRFPA